MAYFQVVKMNVFQQTLMKAIPAWAVGDLIRSVDVSLVKYSARESNINAKTLPNNKD
jgi:hypothetical protein